MKPPPHSKPFLPSSHWTEKGVSLLEVALLVGLSGLFVAGMTSTYQDREAAALRNRLATELAERHISLGQAAARYLNASPFGTSAADGWLTPAELQAAGYLDGTSRSWGPSETALGTSHEVRVSYVDGIPSALAVVETGISPSGDTLTRLGITKANSADLNSAHPTLKAVREQAAQRISSKGPYRAFLANADGTVSSGTIYTGGKSLPAHGLISIIQPIDQAGWWLVRVSFTARAWSEAALSYFLNAGGSGISTASLAEADISFGTYSTTCPNDAIRPVDGGSSLALSAPPSVSQKHLWGVAAAGGGTASFEVCLPATKVVPTTLTGVTIPGTQTREQVGGLSQSGCSSPLPVWGWWRRQILIVGPRQYGLVLGATGSSTTAYMGAAIERLDTGGDAASAPTLNLGNSCNVALNSDAGTSVWTLMR